MNRKQQRRTQAYDRKFHKLAQRCLNVPQDRQGVTLAVQLHRGAASLYRDKTITTREYEQLKAYAKQLAEMAAEKSA